MRSLKAMKVGAPIVAKSCLTSLKTLRSDLLMKQEHGTECMSVEAKVRLEAHEPSIIVQVFSIIKSLNSQKKSYYLAPEGPHRC